MLSFIPVLCLLIIVNGESTVTDSESTSASFNSLDVEFLTKFVSDVKDNYNQYAKFIVTTDINIPKQFSSLAREVITYTDDSYTTLLEDPDFDVNEIERFATNFEWYSSRLEVSGLDPKTKNTAKAMYIPIGLSIFAGVIGLL
ncbi:repressed By RIM101 protein 2 [[Candida] jaroonii]|uniref:Repressed By RIM101 protein 2 n=1 Tax=[Candida] jaroonii TaxID=467808 RepID=A0ACA9YD70_9ASCO|nr:repressed By RIM101 protein 2 [[Candida] jaroonii]